MNGYHGGGDIHGKLQKGQKALKFPFASKVSNVRRNLTFLFGAKSSHFLNEICSGLQIFFIVFQF